MSSGGGWGDLTGVREGTSLLDRIINLFWINDV